LNAILSEGTLSAWRSLFAGQEDRARALIEPVSRELAEIPEEVIWNGWFESGDAELYYALLRGLKPDRVLELGSGFSSSFAARALARNGKGELTCIDPAPRVAPPHGARHLVLPWQEVDPAVFGALTWGDVLFIDSSHEIEEALAYYPLLDALPAGVLVHHHDFLHPGAPAFPEEHLMISYYVLRKNRWEGLISLSLLHHQMGERFTDLFPSSNRAPWRSPGSTWMRKRGP
jgi:predicted O-methyltransferase YrrM